MFIGRFPQLSRLSIGWFLVVGALESLAFASIWELTRVALGTYRWFDIACAQLAGNALSRALPGGAATGGTLEYQMLTSVGFDRRCCVDSGQVTVNRFLSRCGSDRAGEFGERSLDAPVGARVDAELVVTATDVLHERVAADDHARRMVAFESAHRAEPGLESSVVAFDSVVRVLLGVVEPSGHESFDCSA